MMQIDLFSGSAHIWVWGKSPV